MSFEDQFPVKFLVRRVDTQVSQTSVSFMQDSFRR